MNFKVVARRCALTGDTSATNIEITPVEFKVPALTVTRDRRSHGSRRPVPMMEADDVMHLLAEDDSGLWELRGEWAASWPPCRL